MKSWTLLIAIGVLLSLQSPAYAYLDPGTGSLILQGMIGAVAVAGAFLTGYWQKLVHFFGRRKVEDNDQDRDRQ